ncbi:MAG TPA: DUF1572 family protein [Pseudoneobacillus sp.]|nr:DUF1572 family protein [Pseudoneobacillus sp.]
MNVSLAYLKSVEANFKSMKKLAEGAIAQLNFDELHFSPNEESNSVAIIIKHLSGNMISRFTDFLTTDGEKPNRNRDGEFEGSFSSKEHLLEIWEIGWETLFQTLSELKEEDVLKTVLIRGEPHFVMDALQRQVSHYSYHIGQIVYLGKMVKNEKWSSLSIPRNHSSKFNDMMLEKNKHS